MMTKTSEQLLPTNRLIARVHVRLWMWLTGNEESPRNQPLLCFRVSSIDKETDLSNYFAIMGVKTTLNAVKAQTMCVGSCQEIITRQARPSTERAFAVRFRAYEDLLNLLFALVFPSQRSDRVFK